MCVVASMMKEPAEMNLKFDCVEPPHPTQGRHKERERTDPGLLSISDSKLMWTGNWRPFRRTT